MHNLTLNNGTSMPALGLGVYKTLDLTEMQRAVDAALRAGYTSFDTAQMYENEHLLGKALEKSGVARETVFLTSKIDLGNMGYQNAKESFAVSLEKLRTDYLDLLLVHWPGQQKERLQETWRAMEELNRAGRIRAIGVCNCTPRHIGWLTENGGTLPAVNQIERHPLFNQNRLAAWCMEHGIHVEAWAPLVRGGFALPQIVALAEKYKRTPAQIVLRWDIQSGCIVIPKSVHEERIIENAGIFDFELEEEDIRMIDGLETGYTTGWDLESFDY